MKRKRNLTIGVRNAPVLTICSVVAAGGLRLLEALEKPLSLLTFVLVFAVGYWLGGYVGAFGAVAAPAAIVALALAAPGRRPTGG